MGSLLMLVSGPGQALCQPLESLPVTGLSTVSVLLVQLHWYRCSHGHHRRGSLLTHQNVPS